MFINYVIIAELLIFHREKVLTMVFALLSVLSGFAWMAYYSWSLNNYSNLAYKCTGLSYAGHNMCKSITIIKFLPRSKVFYLDHFNRQSCGH